MILVQNHPQLSNGNKRLLLKVYIFILAIFTFVSNLCASKLDTDSTYKIALILPLHLHQYSGANVNRSNIMLDYYQGFYLALKEYEAQGLRIKVCIYDNEHDTSVTKTILQKPELKTMDLIVTPILDEHLHLINHFSSKYQIPVFSPFTAIDSLYPNNPLFFNAVPAKKTKAEFFYEYYRKTNPSKEVLIIKNDADWEKGFGFELLTVLGTKSNIDYRIISSDDMLKADSNFLPKFKNYIVYHGSDDPKGVKLLTSFLDKQKASFEIVGDYKPQTLKLINGAKRKKYDIKIISSDFINPLDSAVILKDFKTTYRLISKLNPSRYSIIGHDQACFISQTLMKYDRFRANDFASDPYQSFATRFIFKKDKHCNQNKGLFILKISDLDLLEEVHF